MCYIVNVISFQNAVIDSKKESLTSSKTGRPLTKFEEASNRTKRRKTEAVRSTLSTSELTYATQMSLRASGSVDAANVLKDATSTPTRASKYRNAITLAVKPPPIEMSPDEALVDMVNLKLTKQQYIDLRLSLREKNFNAYPAYDRVLEAKKLCYPPDIIVTETCAEVKLQSLLDHTCERIIKIQDEVVSVLDPKITSNLRCIFKWGCDGSSGQSEYKQKFSNENSSDSHIFLTSLVPLEIIGRDNDTKKEIVVWKNPRPSSPRFCRPIRVQFLRETVKSTCDEVSYVKNQIETLIPFETEKNGQKVIVTYEMYFTMIDGKVANAITGTKSAMRCLLCQATSNDFNNISKMKGLKINTDCLKYGLSTLHAWIRCFECLLHIGYKVECKKWQARGDENKALVQSRKTTIRKSFKDRLHLNIDCPKPGFGSSNDGNTARRFFENSSMSAEILEVDKILIKKFHTILQVLSSGFAVKVDVFREFCYETAEMFVKLYPWYNMPTTIHKILMHGHQIIQWAPLPIGQLSEDAQEARNKDIKQYREHFARKSERNKTMQDVFQRMMITSDPYISSIGKQLKRQSKNFSSEAMEMFLCTDGSVDDD